MERPVAPGPKARYSDTSKVSVPTNTSMTAISRSPTLPNSQMPFMQRTAPTQNSAKPSNMAHLRSCAGSRRPGAMVRPAGPYQLQLATSCPAGTLAFGPALFGRMSKSKISVGTATVQHALGMSTIPLTRPSTGAVPRIT